MYGSVRFLSVSRPLSARWRPVASSPFTHRPGLSQEDRERTKEKTKEMTKEMTEKKRQKKGTRTAPTPRLRGTMREGVRRNSGCSSHPPPAPNSSASTLRSSSLSLRSRSSHSDASLRASSSAARLGAHLPTSVVERKSSTARLHLVPARRSRILR